MELLSYNTLRTQGYEGYLLADAPERVLQFGGGNFLRGFVDYFIDVANERCGFNGKVVVIQSVSGERLRERFGDQDNLYTLYLRGIEDGKQVERKRVISCISRCLSVDEDFAAILACAHSPAMRYIVSNTTEAGIVFRETDQLEQAAEAAFPGKLTRFMYERFTCGGSGFVVLPCELIEDNGHALKSCVQQYIALWNLGEDFAAWVDTANEFCSTLVDRIVPGHPQNAAELHQQNGYVDNLINSCEPFGFWAIEGPASLNDELPFVGAGLPVLVTPDYTPYKQRKVSILNGAHTSSVYTALLCGLETVGEMMADSLLRAYLDAVIPTEIIPTLDLPRAELDAFAASVMERFQNPYIRHELLGITLNSTSKWRARILPTVLKYQAQTGKLPALLTFSFASYAALFASGKFEVKDDAEVLEFFAAHKGEDGPALLTALCSQHSFWGQDLCAIDGFLPAVTAAYAAIQQQGAKAALTSVLQEVGVL